MNLIEPLSEQIDSEIIENLEKHNYEKALIATAEIIREIHKLIPDKKRISYGIVHCVKTLANHLTKRFADAPEKVFDYGKELFAYQQEPYTEVVGLCMIANYGRNNFETVLPFFVETASSDNWDVREFAQMNFRKLIKKHPEQAQKFLLEQVKSEDKNLRRFVSETLRPVCENKWFYDKPEYSLTVLRNLFEEKAAYPRTSVGNNLSDLARRLPDLVFEIVDELVASGDKNSYRIAYRACRNLVKTQKIRVMDALKIDEYKYKNSKYKRTITQC